MTGKRAESDKPRGPLYICKSIVSKAMIAASHFSRIEAICLTRRKIPTAWGKVSDQNGLRFFSP